MNRAAAEKSNHVSLTEEIQGLSKEREQGIKEHMIEVESLP